MRAGDTGDTGATRRAAMRAGATGDTGAKATAVHAGGAEEEEEAQPLRGRQRALFSEGKMVQEAPSSARF